MLWSFSAKQTCLGLGLAALLGLTGCSASSDPSPEASTPIDGPADAAEVPQEETIGGFRATVIDPPRVTTLASQTAEAQINLRSQPTTLSPILGTGTGGDEVRLLRLAEGEGGHTWYYAQYTAADQEGWVRGDFVDISNATPLANAPANPETSLSQPTLAIASQPCGADRQEAFFETQSYQIYLCKTTQGLRYVGTHKATQAAFVTEDVAVNQAVYIAIDGNQQYHISDTHLAQYEVHDGSYTPLQTEPVLRFERFLY